MSDRKKGPKISWRDLLQGGGARAAEPVDAAAAPAPAPTGDGAAATEVHRILDKLAGRARGARASDERVAPVDEGDTRATAPAAPFAEREVAHRGPRDDAFVEAPALVTIGELREAARLKTGRVELLLFRAGSELFAIGLAAVEEAIESPDIHALPEMSRAMLGVFRLRERLVHAFTPAHVLGVTMTTQAGAALIVRAGERRLAIVVDDVEDVMELDLGTLREPPVVEDTDGILLGVARFGRELVGVADADALITACLGGRSTEIP